MILGHKGPGRPQKKIALFGQWALDGPQPALVNCRSIDIEVQSQYVAPWPPDWWCETVTPSIQRPIVWLLIATLAIVAGVCEGVHFIPGCGHGVQIGDMVLLLGISLPDGEAPTDGQSHVEYPDGPDIPVYDEDLCAICSAVGQTYSSVGPVQLVLAMPLVDELSAVVPAHLDVEPRRPFQARAPPLV